MYLVDRVNNFITANSSHMWGLLDQEINVQIPTSNSTRSKHPILEDPIRAASNAQHGYGEPSTQLVWKLWDLFKMVGYDPHSTFLDIGSGFGKVVFQIALISGWPCYGIEVIKARKAASAMFKEQLKVRFKQSSYLTQAFTRVNFIHMDAAKYDRYQFNGRDATHIYCFNAVFGIQDNDAIASILNLTNFKILVWSKDEAYTSKHLSDL